MKTFLSILFLPIALFGSVLDKTLADQLDAEAGPIIDQIKTSQAATGAKHWQGLETSITPPADGAQKAPDRSWGKAEIAMPAKLMQSIRVDEYVSPKGKGFIIVQMVISNGRTFQKSTGFGPEAAMNTTAWVEVSK